MRLTTILLFIACLQVAAKSNGQTITLDMKNVPVQRVIREASRQSGVSVISNEDMFANTGPVSISVKNASIEEVLNQCLKNQPFTYAFEGKIIVIKPITTPDISRGVISPPPNDIHGRVTDSLGNPLQGVSVTVKGAKTGTTTDANGDFILYHVNENATLIISSVGYEQQVYKLKGKIDLVISLKSHSKSLLEVVVNKGYYNTTQALNTGDVSVVSGDVINKHPVSDPILALEGQVPGLYIQQTSGAPGSYSLIRIMGQNSIANGNDPFYVIDGVPFSSTSPTSPNVGGGMLGFPPTNGENTYGQGLSPFSLLNPADIESIEVLKDADATAIYGSRGANGVILITTRKGKAGNTRVDANVYSGAGKVTRMIPLMNTQQYLSMRHEAFNNDGLTPGSTDFDINGAWDTTRYSNWQKVLIGNSAPFTNAQVTLSGGSANTQFVAGGGYSTQGTVFPGSYSDKKASGYLNVTHSSNDNRFHVQMMVNYISDDNKLPNFDLTNQITLAPDAPVLYNADGSLNWAYINGSSSFPNPLAATVLTATTKSNNFISNLNFNYQIIEGLQLKGNFGYNDMSAVQSILTPGSYYPAPTDNMPSRRRSLFANTEANSWIVEPQLGYEKKIGKGLLSALVGTTFQENTRNSTSEYTFGYSSDLLISNPTAASRVIINGNESTLYHYDALFSRISYNWEEKYLLNLTARRDGSSRFGSGKQFGNFGAVGAAWIFSKEPFVQNSLSFLSFGKLRTSYGITGNDQIGDYQYLSTYYSTGLTYQDLTGLQPSSLTNPNFAWEQVKKLEGEFDLGFLKDRIYISAIYFQNRSSNQLVGYILPLITGFSYVEANFPATVQNSGWEFVMNTTNAHTKNFSWTSSINLTIPQNKLLAFPNIENSGYQNTYAVGQSLFIHYVYHSTGVDPQTGLYSFSTKSGQDWSPTPITDYIISKPVTQSFYGGFQNSFTYKGFQLSFLFQFVKQIGFSYFGGAGIQMPGAFNTNQPTSVLSHWQSPGDIASYGKYTTQYDSVAQSFSNFQRSDGVIVNASFIRLKNLALSYELPAKWKKAAHLQMVKFYIQAQNLFTITNYQGLDPETQGGLTLPPLKMFTGGVQIRL